MPKLYEYFGISVYFYAGEHLPVHVHGRHGSSETVAEIITKNGKIISVQYRKVADRRLLSGTARVILLNWWRPRQKRFCKNGPMFLF